MEMIRGITVAGKRKENNNQYNGMREELRDKQNLSGEEVLM